MEFLKKIDCLKDKIIFSVKKNGHIYNLQKFVRACIYSTKWMPYVRTKIKVKWIYIVLCVLSFPIGIINWFFTPRYDDLPSDGLAIVAIVKNEARYIQEWIDAYLILGVDKIIIFDNGSTDQTETVIKNRGGVGLIDYYFFPGTVRQLDAYNVALSKYKSRYRYMAFVDCDEFLYSDDSLYKTIDYLFSKHQNMGGLGVNCLTFGSSGHQKRPSGGVVENYLWRAEETSNHVIKSIVVSKRTFAFVSPHYPIYRRGYRGFDELGRELINDRTKTVSTRYIRINHYFTKSMEDWVEKVNRGRADLLLHRNLKEFEERDKNDVFDDRLLRLIKALQSHVVR